MKRERPGGHPGRGDSDESSVAVLRSHADDDLRIVTIEEFADVDEPGAEPLLGDPGAVLIPTNGSMMTYGDGGAGKTTLINDLVVHLAAGDPWQKITVQRPLRGLIVENEGPRALYRAKLRAKLNAWTGSPLQGRLHILEEPWAGFTFADESWRATLAAMIERLDLDIVTVGPLVCAGMSEAGTLQQTRAFHALLEDVRAIARHPVTFNLIHHENRGGSVSGAWEGVSDTLLHVTGRGPGRTRLHVQKARWSSVHHGQTLDLRWIDGDGFELEEAPELDDEAIAEMIARAVASDPGTGWSRVEEATPGMSHQRRRAVRDAMLAAGQLLNIARVDGHEVALNHCPERRQARLYLADDHTIRHLRPSPGADGAQSAPPWGRDGQAQLRPAPQLYRGAGGAGADSPPRSTTEGSTHER